MDISVFPGRLGILQRVLPSYRLAFFDLLAESCRDGLSVFAGQPGPGEAIQTADQLKIANLAPARNVHIGRVSSPFYLCWQTGLVGWLEAWNPDALVVEANPRYLSTRLASSWMRHRNRPVLGWGLGVPQSNASGSALRSPGRTRFLSQFDGMIAYSQRGADEYRAVGFPADRVFVAPNAAARRPISPPPQRPEEFHGRARILFVGRLQRRKRIDLLLEACARLPQELQPELDIIGDGPALGELRLLAEKMYPRARFPGAFHGADLAPFFCAADLFVLPGTGGLAVQEAMSYGLPVIVAQGDGTQDDLVRPANGWLVQPGSLDSLLTALHEALSDPRRLRRMGAESHGIVAQDANLEKMVEVFLLALSSVAGSNNR